MDVLHHLGLPTPAHRWWDRAACHNHQLEVFFPSKGATVDVARQVCSGCAVTDDCLAAAMIEEASTKRDHRYGFRGGFTGPERAILAA